MRYTYDTFDVLTLFKCSLTGGTLKKNRKMIPERNCALIRISGEFNKEPWPFKAAPTKHGHDQI